MPYTSSDDVLHRVSLLDADARRRVLAELIEAAAGPGHDAGRAALDETLAALSPAARARLRGALGFHAFTEPPLPRAAAPETL